MEGSGLDSDLTSFPYPREDGADSRRLLGQFGICRDLYGVSPGKKMGGKNATCDLSGGGVADQPEPIGIVTIDC